MQQNKLFGVTLSIVGIWLMVALVALVGIFGPEPTSPYAPPITSFIVPVAFFALIASILLAILGFRGPPATSGS